MSNRSFYFVFVSILISYCSYSQEEPYYALPKERKSEQARKSLPNLDIKVKKIFISGFGGLNIQKQKLDNDLKGQIGIVQNLNLPWGFGFGLNCYNNWQFETGFYKQNINFSTSFQSKLSPRFFTIFQNPVEYYSFPLTVKKRLFYIDKVSKAAQVNIGSGLVITPNLNKIKTNEIFIDDIVRQNGQARDTLVFKNVTTRNLNTLAYQFNLEVEGRIVEKLEIGLFCMGTIYPNKIINSQSMYSINRISQGDSNAFLSNISLIFGVKTKLNLSMLYSYKSKIQ